MSEDEWRRERAPFGASFVAAPPSDDQYGLVIDAAALNLGSSLFRIWLVTFPRDVPAHAVLSARGLVAAHLTAVQPVMLPMLALPVALIRRAWR